jgi:hypothetical protein
MLITASSVPAFRRDESERATSELGDLPFSPEGGLVVCGCLLWLCTVPVEWNGMLIDFTDEIAPGQITRLPQAVRSPK